MSLTQNISYLNKLYRFRELNMEIRVTKETDKYFVNLQFINPKNNKLEKMKISINYLDSVSLESDIVDCPNLLKNISWCIKNIAIQKFQFQCNFDKDAISMHSTFNVMYIKSDTWIEFPLYDILTLVV